MNQRFVKILISGISLALVGLVCVQFYWIDNAVTIKEQEFKENASKALRNVVNTLQKKEVVLLLGKHFRDSESILASENEEGIDFNDFHIIDSADNKISLSIELAREEAYRTCEESWKVRRKESRVRMDEGRIVTTDNYAYTRDINDNEQVVSEWISKIFGNTPSGDLLDRVDPHELDSIIKIELGNMGIRASYEFGVLDSRQNVLLKTQKVSEDQLNYSTYKSVLFPNSFFPSEHILTLYFPHQRGYLLKSVWGILSISVLFILAICFAFWYSIHTIIRQKKLANIKNDFINNMTHELKTPISTISLACEVLGDREMVQSEDRMNHYVKVIKDENKRLGKLVESVLQSAVMEKGKFKLNISSQNIHDILREAILSIEVQVDQKSGSITEQFHATNNWVEVDPVHFSNVIYNLLDNANKYTPEVPRIEVGTEDKDDSILIWVKDNGRGISKENQKKIFDKLYRVPTGNLHDVKGFGLGLSYVMIVVERLGGQVYVKSSLGKGSTFYIEIPITQTEGDGKNESIASGR